jgi:peptidoglycan hydrolase-like protein with peptidoglycan-binding domain
LNLSVFLSPEIDNLKLSSGEINSGDGITAEITSKGGSSQGVIYTFELVKDGTVVENKTVNSTSCSFTPKQPGQYMIRVKVKDRVSTKDYDDMREIALVVKEASQTPGTTDTQTTPTVPGSQTTPQTPSVPQDSQKPPSSQFVFSRTLKKGMTGEDVISLQEALKKLGYFNFEKITNYYGDVTCSSVIVFQKMNNLTPNGIVDSKTAEIINNVLSGYKPPQATPTPSRGSIPPLVVKRTLKKGMTGADVRSLQEKLIKLGYFKQKTTGIFATVTENAVKTFQKAAGLKQTGIVDSTTVKKINDRLKQLQG